MPNNYHADDYNLIHFSAHVAYTWELIGKAGLVYIEKERGYFDNIIKAAGVHMLKLHNLFNNPIYIIKTIPMEPLPPIKLFDDYEPESLDHVSIDLPGQTITINENDLTDLMGYCTLRKKVVDFYIDYIVSRLKPAEKIRIAVVSTADLVNLTRPCTDRDDFFEKEIVIIPLFLSTCMRLTARKGFKPTGVYLLQLLESVLNHLPESENDLHLSDGPTDADYMTPYAFRHAIRHAITNRVCGKQPELKKEPYQFPVANYNEEAAKKRSQDAIAFWDFFIKKKDAADANVA